MAFPRLVPSKGPPEDALAERSDDELMALSQAGLRAAFAALVERHAARLVNLCSRFLNDAELGQELAQDIWVMVWQRRETYRAEGTFLPWLVTVARNHCRNQLRRGKAASAYQKTSAPPELHNSPEQLDSLLNEERRRRVRAALAQLSLPMREVLLLRFAEELRYDQMTSVVGTGESTLRSRVHHGLRILKQKLEEEP